MKLTKSIAIVWLLLTLLPILYMPISMINMMGDSHVTNEEFRQQFDSFRQYTLIFIFWGWGIIAAYIVFIFKSTVVPKDKKALWAVVIFFAHIFAMPFFWYLYIWRPLTPQSHEIEGSKIDKIPYIIGLLIFLIIPISIILFQFKTANSYKFLTKALPVTTVTNNKYLNIDLLSITKSKRIHGATRLENIMNLYLTESSLVFKPKKPYSIIYESFEIKKEDLHSCSKQCGGRTEYILILEKLDTQVSMEGVHELVDWCWDNQIPMLPAKNRREWLYNGGKLPSYEVFIDQLSNHDNYAYQTKRSCQGY